MTTPAPTAGAPPTGAHGLAVRAALEGKAAAEAGHPANACPYAASRPFTRRAWLLGYTAGAPERDLDVDPVAPWPGDTPTED